MPIATSSTTATTTAALLVDAQGASAQAPRYIKIANVGSTTVYVGGSDVTTSNGYPISGTSSDSFTQLAADHLYIIATTNAAVRVFKTLS